MGLDLKTFSQAVNNEQCFFTGPEIFDQIGVMTWHMGSTGQFVWVKSVEFEMLTLTSDHLGDIIPQDDNNSICYITELCKLVRN